MGNEPGKPEQARIGSKPVVSQAVKKKLAFRGVKYHSKN